MFGGSKEITSVFWLDEILEGKMNKGIFKDHDTLFMNKN